MSEQTPHNKPKSPAASHMLWFFVIPCVVFVGWASWRLVGAALAVKPKDLQARLEAVKTARSSGDRWQSVYSLSQELQRLKSQGEWDTLLTSDQKRELFESLDSLKKEHDSDLRFKKYVLLSFGQFGDDSVLKFVEPSLTHADLETRFYAAWAYIELLMRNRSAINEERLAQVRLWLKDADLSLRKISASFLVQLERPDLISEVESLLQDPENEVRWNAAVALASVKNAKASGVLMEMFDLQKIRSAELRSVEDLKQFLASAMEAARKLGSAEVLAQAEKLKAQVSPTTPEGKAIHEALR